MMNKKAVTWWMNAVMTILMIFLVVMGVLLLNLTSDKNIITSKQKSDFARNQFHAKETLNVLSKTTINSDIGKISFPEALDKYFWLENKDHLTSSEDKLKNQLGSNMIIETDELVKDYAYVEAEYYFRDTLQDNFMLYSNPKLFKQNFDYSGSVILPSSNSRTADYYINISLYYPNNVETGTKTVMFID